MGRAAVRSREKFFLSLVNVGIATYADDPAIAFGVSCYSIGASRLRSHMADTIT
jgi:hypothetical protein